MDETPKIPYYFPPQRYIPRLGGGGESPMNAAGGFFGGLKDAFELYLQLQNAKEGRQERDADRKERTDAQVSRQKFQDEDLNLRREEMTSRAREQQQDRENQELQYGQRAGITLDPGVVRQKMEAPVAPQTLGFAGAPTAEGVSKVVQGMRPSQEAGLSGLFQQGGEALKRSYDSGKPETFEGGFAVRPASEERYNFRASESADRLQETKLRVAREALNDWEHSQATYAIQKLDEFKVQNPYPTPQQERQIIDQARARYESVRPRPSFDPTIQHDLGQEGSPAPAKQPDALDAAIEQALQSGAYSKKKPQ